VALQTHWTVPVARRLSHVDGHRGFRGSEPVAAHRRVRSTRGRARDRRAENRQRGGDLGRGAAATPTPPHQLGSLEERCELPRRGSMSRPPKGFPLFSALRMASPDTDSNVAVFFFYCDLCCVFLCIFFSFTVLCVDCVFYCLLPSE